MSLNNLLSKWLNGIFDKGSFDVLTPSHIDILFILKVVWIYFGIWKVQGNRIHATMHSFYFLWVCVNLKLQSFERKKIESVLVKVWEEFANVKSKMTENQFKWFKAWQIQLHRLAKSLMKRSWRQWKSIFVNLINYTFHFIVNVINIT